MVNTHTLVIDIAVIHHSLYQCFLRVFIIIVFEFDLYEFGYLIDSHFLLTKSVGF